MNIREFYDTTSGNYEEAIGRLGNEKALLRFVKKFAGDPSFEELTEALMEEDPEEAFRAAHNLKGVCKNLAFASLAESASEITELLRGQDNCREEAKLCYEKVKTTYENVIDAIVQLEP